MTITSFTSDKKYETTLEHCSCPDYQYRRRQAGQACKHMQVLAQELNETIEQATVFLSLKAQYDVRELQRKASEQRAAYAAMYNPCGIE